MLSVFPELLNYSLAGVFILRLALGLLFIKYGIVKIFLKKSGWWKTIGAVELVCGVLLAVGLFTQPAALLVSVLMFGAIAIKIKTKNEVLKSPYDFYLLLIVVSLSLLFLGPGIFSFDLPL